MRVDGLSAMMGIYMAVVVLVGVVVVVDVVDMVPSQCALSVCCFQKVPNAG